MADEEMFNPGSMQDIVDRLKREGRFPTPEKFAQVIADTRAEYQMKVAKARKEDRFQAKKRAARGSSKSTS